MSDFESRLRSTPFLPFRVAMASGESYEVHHPNLVIIGDVFVMIGLPFPDSPTVASRISRVPIEHITALEDLLPPPAPSTKKKKREAA
jgi:hypothetical protein